MSQSFWRNLSVMLKQPALISSDLDLWVIKCNCRTYDENIGPELCTGRPACTGQYNCIFFAGINAIPSIFDILSVGFLVIE